MRRWTTQMCPTKEHSGDEVGESLVGDGSYSRIVLVNVSTQGWRKEEVHKPCVRLGKGSRKGRWGGEGRGWFEEEVEGLPSCVKSKEVGRGGLVTRSLSMYCLLVKLGMENEKFKERRKKTKKVGVLISMKMLYQAWVRAWLE